VDDVDVEGVVFDGTRDGKGMARVWSQKGEVSPSSSTRVEHL
jgi:hypothetical protein